MVKRTAVNGKSSNGQCSMDCGQMDSDQMDSGQTNSGHIGSGYASDSGQMESGQGEQLNRLRSAGPPRWASRRDGICRRDGDGGSTREEGYDERGREEGTKG